MRRRRQCGLMLQLLQQLVRPITSIFCYLFTYVLHSPIGFNNVLHFNALCDKNNKNRHIIVTTIILTGRDFAWRNGSHASCYPVENRRLSQWWCHIRRRSNLCITAVLPYHYLRSPEGKMAHSIINMCQRTLVMSLSQSCAWVHSVWPDPTQPISWLTQPTNPIQVEKFGPNPTHPNAANNGAYSLVVTYFYTRKLSRTFMWSLTYQQSLFNRYYYSKHFSELHKPPQAASEMTYTVSGGALNSTQTKPNFTHKMAPKFSWHRYGTKLRHCHAVNNNDGLTSVWKDSLVRFDDFEVDLVLFVADADCRPAWPSVDRCSVWTTHCLACSWRRPTVYTAPSRFEITTDGKTSSSDDLDAKKTKFQKGPFLEIAELPYSPHRDAECWWRSTVVERRSLTGELSLSCARPAADGWPLMWVNHPLQVSQLGQLSLSSFRGR